MTSLCSEDTPPISHPGRGSDQPTAPDAHTAQPPLTSGFAALIERERELQSLVATCIDQKGSGQHTSLDSLLREHREQLGAIIALLEQRYELLPVPGRFHAP